MVRYLAGLFIPLVLIPQHQKTRGAEKTLLLDPLCSFESTKQTMDGSIASPTELTQHSQWSIDSDEHTNRSDNCRYFAIDHSFCE